jgi:hypothetical protein
VIDSVAFRWEHLPLDFEELASRLGSDAGEVRSIRYGQRNKDYGHWSSGSAAVMYTGAGRLELRSSLPKLLTGQNDALLSEAGVHAALAELTRVGSEVTGVDLDLVAASPLRLDYVYQWEVPSVAAILAEMKTSFQPGRKRMTEEINSSGARGRSLYYGKGGKQVLRFYDKRAEVAEALLREVTHGVDQELLDQMTPLEREIAMREGRRASRERFLHDAGIDTLLRYEVQDRRRASLERIRDGGYLATDVHEELARPLQSFHEARIRNVDELLAEASVAKWPHAVAYTLAALQLGEHPELWPSLRMHASRNVFSRWRRRSRQAAPKTWIPEIPADAFEAPAQGEASVAA